MHTSHSLLAPVQTREPGQRALQEFLTVSQRRMRRDAEGSRPGFPGYSRNPAILKKRGEESRGTASGGSGTGPLAMPSLEQALAALADSSTFTNAMAESLADPFHAPRTSMESRASTAAARLTASVARVPWNTPQPHPEWSRDVRLASDWWVSLQPMELRTDEEEPLPEVRPFLVPANNVSLSPWEEDQLFADLAMHFVNAVLHKLQQLHLDGALLSADRMHVLVFGGFVARMRREARERPAADATAAKDSQAASGATASFAADSALVDTGIATLATLSLPMCQVDSASLYMLLLGLGLLAKEITGELMKVLDLGYNLITSRAFNILTALLPRTNVHRLCLRGNVLQGTDNNAFRDFLLEGCKKLVELDLSHAKLTSPQIVVLIEALPEMSHLRVLLLDWNTVPADRSTALCRAVAESHLWHISLDGCGPCSSGVYATAITEACRRNRERVMPADTNLEGVFNRLYQSYAQRGWLPPTALPREYKPFTNNDPSLVNVK